MCSEQGLDFGVAATQGVAMVSRKPSAPPTVVVKQFTPEEIERGIAQFQRRLNDIAAFIPETTARPGG